MNKVQTVASGTKSILGLQNFPRIFFKIHTLQVISPFLRFHLKTINGFVFLHFKPVLALLWDDKWPKMVMGCDYRGL